MRRSVGLAALGACLLAGAAPALGGEAAGTRANPSRLLVTADEWRLTLSRPSMVPGHAVIQLANAGEDAHDLRLRRMYPRRPDGTRSPTKLVRETASGELTEIQTRLPRGRYRLWCSLPGHRALGMDAKLRVERAVSSR